MLTVIFCHYAACHYAECHFAECRGAEKKFYNNGPRCQLKPEMVPRMLDSGRVQRHPVEQRRMLEESGNTSGVDPAEGHAVRVTPEGHDVVADPLKS